MILTEYDEEKTLKELAEEQKEIGKAEGREEGRAEGRKEGRAEGRKEGRAEGRFESLTDLVSDGTISLTKAAQKAGMTVSEFKKRAAQLRKQTANA